MNWRTELGSTGLYWAGAASRCRVTAERDVALMEPVGTQGRPSNGAMSLTRQRVDQAPVPAAAAVM
jgi:hypothetical protein